MKKLLKKSILFKGKSVVSRIDKTPNNSFWLVVEHRFYCEATKANFISGPFPSRRTLPTSIDCWIVMYNGKSAASSINRQAKNSNNTKCCHLANGQTFTIRRRWSPIHSTLSLCLLFQVYINCNHQGHCIVCKTMQRFRTHVCDEPSSGLIESRHWLAGSCEPTARVV